jgi:hypothetical protein
MELAHILLIIQSRSCAHVLYRVGVQGNFFFFYLICAIILIKSNTDVMQHGITLMVKEDVEVMN